MSAYQVFSALSKPSPLPFFSPPQKGESYFGYLLRLKELNFYPELGWIPSLFTEKKFAISVKYMHENASQTAEGLRLEQSAFSGVMYHLGPNGHYRVRIDDGVELNINYLELGSRKICPQCLAEFGYVHKAWELKPLVACPRHAVYLITECQKCGAKLSPNRGQLCICQECGWDFRKSTREKIPLGDLQMAKLIGSKSIVPYTCNGHDIPSVWRDEALSVVLSNYYLLYKYHPKRKSRIKGHVIDWGEASRLCVSIFMDWPNSYVTYLQAQVSFENNRETKPRPKGISNSIGPFYSAITTNDKDGRFRHLKELMSQYILNNETMYSVTRRGGCSIFDNSVPAPIYMTQQEVRKELNICSNRFLDLFKQGTLEGIQLPLGKQHIFRIFRKSVEQYLKKNGNLWSLQKFQQELGVTPTVCGNLIKSGLFTMERLEDKAPRIDMSGLDAFKIMISRPAPSVFFPPGKLLPFVDACRFAARLSGFSMLTFIKGIKAGSIRPRLVVPKRRFLNGIYYAEWDVRNLAGQKYVSAADVFLAFKIDPASAAVKIINKKLDMGTRCKDQRRLFSLKKAISFTRNYIPPEFLQQHPCLDDHVKDIVSRRSVQHRTLPKDAITRFLLRYPVVLHRAQISHPKRKEDEDLACLVRERLDGLEI